MLIALVFANKNTLQSQFYKILKKLYRTRNSDSFYKNLLNKINS